MPLVDTDGSLIDSTSLVKGDVTHKKLTKCGLDWLLAKGCNPVFCEKGFGSGGEIPDVIGWDGNNCYVIECKTSLSDYRADKNKPHRFSGGLGGLRYYLVPSELKDKIPNDTGWGLLVAKPAFDYDVYTTRQVKGRGSKDFERNVYAEISYLRLRVLGIQNYGR